MSKSASLSKYSKKNHYDIMLPPIPERWENYKPCGRVIEGTRIICFKVPIREQFQRTSTADIWDIKTLLTTIPNLGAVIDLTNTTRYYKGVELKSRGIAYKKIFVQGKLVPSEGKVKHFIEAIDSFTDKSKLIGVHCTHGVNRTGYLVCRYLRDRCHIPANKAIKAFEKARGYRIERENYIADLLGRAVNFADENLGGDSETAVSGAKKAKKIVTKKNVIDKKEKSKKTQ